MKSIVVFVALMAIVNGRPQYNYPRPGGPGRPVNRPTTGGAPFPGKNRITGGVEPNGYRYEQPAAAGQIAGGQVASNHVSHGQFSGSQISGGQFSGSQISGGQVSNGQVLGAGSLRGSSEQQGQYGRQQPNQQIQYGGAETIIHKHVYVHIPPPELEEEPVEQRPVSAVKPETHYKIIFIKAPAPATPAARVIPLQATREEKTLVYVLVKKPEEAQQITLPTPEPTHPSKPEVYFIRYKGVKGEDAQQGGYQEHSAQQEDYQGGGAQQGSYQEGSYQEGSMQDSYQGKVGLGGYNTMQNVASVVADYLPPQQLRI